MSRRISGVLGLILLVLLILILFFLFFLGFGSFRTASVGEPLVLLGEYTIPHPSQPFLITPLDSEIFEYDFRGYGGGNGECSSDSECDDSDAYTHDICQDPGTSRSECVYEDIACLSDTDCDDSDADTIDKCRHPGTVGSSCIHDPVSCSADSDCDDSNNLTIDSCENPGTSVSQCIHDSIVCASNVDCNDHNSYTIDTCSNPGTVQSQCVNTPIACTVHSDCNDSHMFTEDRCHNAGTVQSFCTNENINCHTDAECSDGDDLTIDSCALSGTPLSYCVHNTIDCVVDSQCPADSVGGNYCSYDAVVRDVTSYSCVANSCVSSTTPETIQMCADTCSNGQCASIACYTNSECNDGNANTTDICHNPGLVSSYCSHDALPIACSSAQDCNDSNSLTIDSCENPGTVQSQCVNTPIACTVHSDCNDSNIFTNDKCHNAGTVQSFCTNDPIMCMNDAQCSDGNDLTIDDCVYPGTPISFCTHDLIECTRNSHCPANVYGGKYCSQDDVVRDVTSYSCVANSCVPSTKPKTIQMCSDTCQDGQCKTISCSTNTDCGTTGFEQEPFCVAGDVYDVYTTATCKHPGTVGSYCEVTHEDKVFEMCMEGCSNGQCEDIPGAPVCDEPFDVVLVVDRSRDMRSPSGDMTAVKNANTLFVNTLDSSVEKVGLVTFAKRASLDPRLTSNFNEVREEIREIKASDDNDGRNTGGAVYKAQKTLDDRGRSGVPHIMIVVSDGVPTVKYKKPNDDDIQKCSGAGATACTSYAVDNAAAAKARGTIVYTIGLRVDGTFAEDVLEAMASPGKYYSATNAGELNDIYTDIVNDVCG